MEKIVVLTDDSARDENLIKCLEIMFPECVVEVKSKQPCNQGRFLSPEISPDFNTCQATDKYLGLL